MINNIPVEFSDDRLYQKEFKYFTLDEIIINSFIMQLINNNLTDKIMYINETKFCPYWTKFTQIYKKPIYQIIAGNDETLKEFNQKRLSLNPLSLFIKTDRLLLAWKNSRYFPNTFIFNINKINYPLSELLEDYSQINIKNKIGIFYNYTKEEEKILDKHLDISLKINNVYIMVKQGDIKLLDLIFYLDKTAGARNNIILYSKIIHDKLVNM